METAAFLQLAAICGIEIEVVYNGGSHPGATRHILPLTVRGDVVRAKDSGYAKTFRIELLTLAITPDIRFHQYVSIHEILLYEQCRILESGLSFEADRYHLRLFDAPISTPVISIWNDWGVWRMNGKRFNTFQAAAEAFVFALAMQNR